MIDNLISYVYDSDSCTYLIDIGHGISMGVTVCSNTTMISLMDHDGVEFAHVATAVRMTDDQINELTGQMHTIKESPSAKKLKCSKIIE